MSQPVNAFEIHQTIWTRGRKAQTQLNVKQRLHYLILPAKTSQKQPHQRSQIRFLNIHFDLSVRDTFVLALGFILKHTAVLASDLHCASVRHVKRGSADGDASVHLFRRHFYSVRPSLGSLIRFLQTMSAYCSYTESESCRNF